MLDKVYLNPHTQGGFILVEAKVFSLIDGYRQDQFFKKEAGGVLLGYRRGVHIHVSDATGPQKKDLRTRFSFNRKDPHHQWYADELWNKSGGVVGYLGEWHTHPEQLPKPSSVDTGDWLRITTIQAQPCVFIIGSSAGLSNIYLSCVCKDVIKDCKYSE